MTGQEIVAACTHTPPFAGAWEKGACAACIDGALHAPVLKSEWQTREAEVLALREALEWLAHGARNAVPVPARTQTWEECVRIMEVKAREALSSTAPVAARIREEIRQEVERDALLVVAVLVGRLGGSVEIGLADIEAIRKDVLVRDEGPMRDTMRFRLRARHPEEP